jgi:DNA-binding LacI/PurR family transcriptional regulator
MCCISRIHVAAITGCQLDFSAQLAEKLGQFFDPNSMQPIRRPNVSEHTAQHLREGFRSGRWSGKLPGVGLLAKELGVSRDAVRAALRLLEQEGIIASGGAGRSRTLAAPAGLDSRRVLRVGILLPSPMEKDNALTHELIFSVRQAIEALGHVCFIAAKSSQQLHGRPERIRRHMADCKADAWIVYSAGREILEMVSASELPALALGGPAMGLGLASSRADLAVPLRTCVDCLADYGHKRMVLISPREWRLPSPNSSSQVFLDRLSHHGIRASARYNLPDWERTPEGLNKLLQSLFIATPPTALLLVEPEWLGPVLVFLAARGLRVPYHVSVVNIIPDPMQAFYRPAIAHFQWPVHPHVKRVLQWVNAIARGESDLKNKTTQPIFVPAESISSIRAPMADSRG